jgi:hypothetical protein
VPAQIPGPHSIQVSLNSLNSAHSQCILSIRALDFVQERVVDMRLQYYKAMYGP